MTSLLLLTVIVLPWLTTESKDTAPDAFVTLFTSAYENGLVEETSFNRITQEFHDHFVDTDLKPVELRIGNMAFPFIEWRKYTSYKKDRYIVKKGAIFLGFDVSERNKEAAIYHILFDLYVILALLVFSGLLNAKTTELVVRPLGYIFNLIQEHASYLMVTLDTDLRHQVRLALC
eukprot:1196200-Prorocentrum_minimum.AAC.8